MAGYAFDRSIFQPTPEQYEAARGREREAERRKAEIKAAGRKMTEAERQRARVDALVIWFEKRVQELNDYGPGAIGTADLKFPDPYPTTDAPEHKPRTLRENRNAAAALAFLENDK
ncbi:hypothetical protein ACIQ7D_24015 [Streptomyces sp. NPDC096310]|uniref:hypothetical protein n=1 Tax=Streptomyces sp. NPDC096310 TaxID=3366082 RepID=UPI0037FA7903